MQTLQNNHNNRHRIGRRIIILASWKSSSPQPFSAKSRCQHSFLGIWRRCHPGDGLRVVNPDIGKVVALRVEFCVFRFCCMCRTVPTIMVPRVFGGRHQSETQQLSSGRWHKIKF